jgi:hypothetical protein
MKKNSSESASMTFEELLFSTFNKIKLDVSIDSLTTVRGRNSEKSTPFAIRT